MTFSPVLVWALDWLLAKISASTGLPLHKGWSNIVATGHRPHLRARWWLPLKAAVRVATRYRMKSGHINFTWHAKRMKTVQRCHFIQRPPPINYKALQILCPLCCSASLPSYLAEIAVLSPNMLIRLWWHLEGAWGMPRCVQASVQVAQYSPLWVRDPCRVE